MLSGRDEEENGSEDTAEEDSHAWRRCEVFTYHADKLLEGTV